MVRQIQSTRTILRRFNLSDFKNMRMLESDAEIMKFTTYRVPQTLEQTQNRLILLIEKESSFAPLGVWAVEHKENNKFIGWFMLRATDLEFPELGFMLVKEFWGHGFAIEIAKALIEYAFNDLKLAGISAATDVNNVISEHILTSLGFQFVKIISIAEKDEGSGLPLKIFNCFRRSL